MSRDDPSSTDSIDPEAPLALAGSAADQRDGRAETANPTEPLVPRDEIRRAMQQLPRLLALGMIKPPTSNAMLRAYDSLLAQWDKSAQSGTGQLADANMLLILREKPELQKLLVPILTDEQIALLVKDATRDPQSEA